MGNEVADPPFPLQGTAHHQQPSLQDGPTPGLHLARPDDDVDPVALVFQGQEYRSVGRSRALTMGDEASDTSRPSSKSAP